MIQTLNFWLKYVRQQNHNKNYDEKYNPENVHEYQLKTHKLIFMSKHLSMKGKKVWYKIRFKINKKRNEHIAWRGKYYRVEKRFKTKYHETSYFII